MRSSRSRGITLSCVPVDDEHRHVRRVGRCRRGRRRRTAACREHGGAGVPGRVVEDQAAGEGGAAAEPDEHDRPARRASASSQPPEPLHGLRERLGDGTADAAVGEPGVAAALGDRRSHRRVGQPARQVPGEVDDVLLVGAAAVQQHDQRGVRVGRAAVRQTGSANVVTRVSSTIRPAVRRPPQRRTSPARSSRSVGGAVRHLAPGVARQHPHHLELVAVRVDAVDALGGAVAGLAGVRAEVRERQPGRARSSMVSTCQARW